MEVKDRDTLIVSEQNEMIELVSITFMRVYKFIKLGTKVYDIIKSNSQKSTFYMNVKYEVKILVFK